MAQSVYAVVGSGTAPAAVITEGLNDALKEGDAISLVWETPEDDDGIAAVYDYILDNEVQFVMYYEEGDKVPRVFREAEHGVVQKVKTPSLKALKDIAGKGKVLFLWDTNYDDDQIDGVFDNINEGVLVLELTNGLDPIKEVGPDEIPTPVDPDLKDVDPDEQPPDEKEDDARFTKAELEVMAAAAVKRYGKRVGAKATTAKGIIAELFPSPSDDDDEVEKDDGPLPDVTYPEAPGPHDVPQALIDKLDAFLTATFGAKYTEFSS